jgi:anti-anti-sigma factor
VEITINGSILTFKLADDLIASHVDKLVSQINTACKENENYDSVEMDLTNVKEIDSLGINFIVGLYKQLTEEEIKFFVSNTSRQIKNLFNLFKLSSYFEVK